MALNQVVQTPIQNSQDSGDSLSNLQMKLNTLPSEAYSIESTLQQHGHIPVTQLTKTLQGSIWKVSKTDSSSDTCVIKVASKALHNQHIAYINGTQYSIQENILKEAHILRYLTDCNNQPPPDALIKYVDCFSDERNHFLVLENGGRCLFEVIQECHSLIKSGILSISQWHSFCRRAMQQMLDVMSWLHSQMNVCHLDVSLENFAIQNMNLTVAMHLDSVPTVELGSDFQIKIIDFGVAEVFSSKNQDGQIDFQCTKYVGRTGYKAPEVYRKEGMFDARSADCWSLAVCFFMMCFGCAPYYKPSETDLLFNLMMEGRLVDVIENWDMVEYATPQIFDLLLRLFVPEKRRLTVADIKKHSWFN